MLSKALRQAVKQAETAKTALEEAILDAIDKKARKLGYTKIIFSMFGTTCYDKNGLVVLDGKNGPKAIREIEDLYLDHINSSGFQAIWSKANGWK